MFSMLSNIAKAAVAMAVSPVALVADILTLPDSASDPHRGPFERTGAMLKRAGECIEEATKPDQGDQR